MKKKSTAFLKAALLWGLLTVTAVSTGAVSADPAPFRTEQPDGTEVIVQTYGDEHFHWNEDENGWLICYQESDRTWYYAVLDENSNLVPGSAAAGGTSGANSASSEESGFRLTFADITDLAESRAEASRAVSAVEAEDGNAGAGGSASAADTPAFGTSDVHAVKNNAQDLLLLLIEYTDVSMYNSIDFWGDRYFGMEGNTVNNYYMDQSGSFDLHFNRIVFTHENGEVPLQDTSVIQKIELKDGVAKVTFNKPHPCDKLAVDDDVKEAFSYVRNYIDFSKYKGEAIYNNHILQEYFQTAAVVAGWEGSSAGSSPYQQKVWAHANYWYFGTIYNRIQFSLNLAERDINGETCPPYTLMSYMVHGELYAGSPADGTAQTMGVGVSVHEMGHCLGLPDLYDVGTDSAGLSIFSVMGTGSWGAKAGEQQSTTPVGFDAWSKVQLGFAKPVVITADQKNVVQTLTDSSDSPTILKLTSSADPKQYFLVENRQLTGYDAGLAYYDLGLSHNNGGIWVYQIDESVITSGKDPNNNRYHYGVELLFADGSDILRTRDQRYFGGYAPFFTADGYGEFHSDTPSSSEFYVAGHTSQHNDDNAAFDHPCHLRSVLSGITLKVLDSSASSMKVHVNMQEGDINGDGRVTPADRMLLARYCNEWQTGITLNRYAADLNKDYQVNEDDILIFGRYFAGWPGYESLPHT